MQMKEKYAGYRKLEIRELQMLQLEAMKHIHQICVDNNIKYYIIAGSILGAVRHGGFIPWDDDIDLGMMREDYERFKLIFGQQCNKEKYFLQHYGTDKNFRYALMRVCIKNTILDIPEIMNLDVCHNTYLDVFPLDNVPDDTALQEEQAEQIVKLKQQIVAPYYIRNFENKGLKKVKEIFKYLRAKINSIRFNKQRDRQKLIDTMTRYSNEDTEYVCSMASGYSYKKQTMPRFYYGEPTLINFEDTQFFGPEKTELYLKALYGEDYMIPKNKFKGGHAHDVYLKDEN